MRAPPSVRGLVTQVDAERHLVHTAAGDELLVRPAAARARRRSRELPLPGALCLRGPGRRGRARAAGRGRASPARSTASSSRSPRAPAWALPLYELALLTRAWLVDAGAIGVRVAVVTPEDARSSSSARRRARRSPSCSRPAGSSSLPETIPLAFADGALSVAPGGSVEADRAVALPRLEGPRLDGVPQTRRVHRRPTTAARSTSEIDV